MSNLFKHVGTDENGQNIYELIETGLHLNAKPIRAIKDSNGCLKVFTHRASNNTGHVSLKRNNKPIYVHRLTWMLDRQREILDGYTINHLCDVGNCINPEHIYMGTNADNMRDKTEEGKRKRVIIRLPQGQA